MKAIFAILASMLISLPAHAAGDGNNASVASGGSSHNHSAVVDDGYSNASSAVNYHGVGHRGDNRDPRATCAYAMASMVTSNTLQFNSKKAVFKLIGSKDNLVTIHTKKPFSTNDQMYFKRSSVGAPKEVAEILKVDGVTSVRIVDAYSLYVYHGELFENNEILYNLCVALGIAAR